MVVLSTTSTASIGSEVLSENNQKSGLNFAYGNTAVMIPDPAALVVPAPETVK